MGNSSPSGQGADSSKRSSGLYTRAMRKLFAGIVIAVHLVGCASQGVAVGPAAAPPTAPAHPSTSSAPDAMGTGEVVATEVVAAAAQGAATAGSVAAGASGLAASVWLAGAAPAVLFGMVFAAVFVSEGLGYQPTAPMDPTRAVHEQDCTKPIDYTRGNLQCAAAGKRP
jgi:fatty acid desaturase